jgi:hypothetical protein
MRVRKTVSDLIELAVMTTFVLIVIWDEHRKQRAGLVSREL